MGDWAAVGADQGEAPVGAGPGGEDVGQGAGVGGVQRPVPGHVPGCLRLAEPGGQRQGEVYPAGSLALRTRPAVVCGPVAVAGPAVAAGLAVAAGPGAVTGL